MSKLKDSLDKSNRIRFISMGVIHKLKKEVVQYIIEQKKANPKISCRKLSEVVSGAFKINVSKSSVNTILKNASLSSGVGRRTGTTNPPKSFKIPERKKNELFSRIPKPTIIQGGQVIKKGIVPAPKAERLAGPPGTLLEKGHQKKADLRHAIDEFISQESISGDSEEDALTLLPDPVGGEMSVSASAGKAAAGETKDFSASQPKPAGLRPADLGKLFEGAGFVFLKAAEAEFSQQGFLGEALKPHFGDRAPANFSDLCSALVFLRQLNVQSVHDYKNYLDHALWHLNDVSDKAHINAIIDWCSGAKVSNAMIVDYEFAAQQALVKASELRIELSSGTFLRLDPQMGALWKAGIPPALHAPLEKTLSILSKFLISNNQHAVFCIAPGEKSVDDSFFDLLACLELRKNIEIRRIAVLDVQSREVAEFASIPRKRRLFIAGIGPWQNEFDELTRAVMWTSRKAHYFQEFERFYYLSENQTDFFNKKWNTKEDFLRVITIWKDKAQDPVLALLTNDEGLDAEQILSRYLLRWPYLHESGPIYSIRGLHEDLIQKGVSGPAENLMRDASYSSVWDILDDYRERLKNHIVERFLSPKIPVRDETHIISMICDLKGYVLNKTEEILCAFDVPENFPYIAQLNMAIKRVNEHNIESRRGKRLILRIQTSPE